MDQRNLKCYQRFKRYCRSRRKPLESILEQRKSGGDPILGEGEESLKNPLRIEGETPNCQGFALVAVESEWGKRLESK
jgi:hypothetical protein